jgi:hypothetical protein
MKMLRQLVNESHRENLNPLLEEVYHGDLNEDDIVYYLKTETDRRRLAYWCHQYLKLEF